MLNKGQFLKLILAVSITAQLGVPAAFCQAESAGSSTPARTPVELDFSSTDKTMSAGKISTPVNIQVGSNSVQVTSSSVLTPGEYAAAMQVLHTGQQSVILGDLGNAVGGQVNLTKVHSPISTLVIPQGVIAVNNFGLTNGALAISGNLTNAGTLYAVSTVSQITNANIFANNISNLQSGLITSVLPQAGLPGITGAINNLNLNLTAVNNIINAGSITSAGSLSAIAGNSIINSSQSAVMQAMQNVNLQALNVFNAGSIIAQAGNLNVATSTLTNQAMMQSVLGNINILNSVNPALGLNVSSSATAVMQALNGSINFGVVDDMAKTAMNIDGGTFIGTGLNINSGEGALHVNVRDIQAPLDVVKAGLADVAITDGTKGLNIVGFNITGDPNLMYTGAGPYTSGAFSSDGGFVNINTSSDTVNGSITFTGNINTTPTANGSGGSVTLNAGTSITTTNITTDNRSTGSAGAISLTAKTGITTATLSARGQNDANGGSITLDSGTGSFSLGSLYTCSEDPVNAVGTGTPGALIFKQNGGTLTNPTISFVNNAQIGVYGATAGSTSSVQFTMGNANAVDYVITKNIGTGTSGNIIITSPFALSVRQADSDSRGTGGLVQLTSGGAITSTTRISGSGLSNGNAGSVILDSATATFNVDEVYARSQTDPFYSSGGPMGPVNTGTGNGSPGTVLFKQNGVTLPNPSITFVGTNNREIEVDGTSASPTQSYSINVIGTGGTALGLFGNYNKGTGGTGNVTINASTAITLYGVSTAAVSGVAGNVTVAVAGNLAFNGEGIHGSGTSGGNINVTTSASGTIDLGSDPWVTNGNATVSAAGTLSNVGTMSASNITITAGSGSLSLPSAINGTTSVSLTCPNSMTSSTISNVTTPRLNLTSTAGNIGVTFGAVTIPSASVSVNASGSVNITKGSAMAIAGDSSAGTTFVAATTSGALSVTNGSDISASSTLALTTSNGAIQLTGGTLSTNTGTITITVGGAANGLTSSGNNIVISAGDDISLAIGNNTINTTGAGSGGSVQLTAGVGTVGGSINEAGTSIITSGTGTGAGGGVSLQATNGTSALIAIGAITANGAGATASGTNATNGAVSGVTITSGGALTVGTISARNTTAGSVVNGGNVSLTMNTAGTFTIGSIQTSGGLSSGNGGDVSVRNNGAGGITVNLSSSFPANATNGRGGNITLNAAGGGTPGPLTFTGGIILSTSSSVSGAGGNITLSGSQISLGGGTLQLWTGGAGGAADGDISITTTSTAAAGNITLGNAVANQVTVSAPNGHVTVTSGNVLTIIDPVTVGRFDGTGNTIAFNASLTANNGIFLNSTGDITATIYNGVPSFFNAADSNPGSTAINPAGTFMYVTNYGSADVSVVNLANNTFVTNIAVGTNPVSLVMNPAGTFVYVANASTNNVSVINTATNTVTAVIAVGTLPQGIGINPAGTRVYVPNYNSNTVSVINTATNTVVNTISTGAGSRPTNVAITPDGAYAYVTYNTSNSVGVIDTASNTVVATVPVGSTPVGININPAGTYAYVGNKAGNSVSVININSNEVVGTIAVGTAPVGITFNPSGAFAYVANETSGTVSVINTRSNAVVATWTVGLAPQTVAIKPDGLGAYVANSSSPAAQGLSFIDLSGSLTSTGTISFTTTAGNVGSSTSPLITNAGTLQVNTAGAAKDVYVFETSAATLLSSSTSGIFNLVAAGTLTNTGTLSTSTGAIQLNTPSLINNGAITTTSATAPPISVSYAANMALDGTGTFTAPAGGTITFNTTSSNGQVTLASGAALTSTAASGILIQGKQINFNGGTLTANGAAAVTINTNGSAKPLTINVATGTTSGAITTTGGTIAITPTAGQTLTFSQSGAGSGTINLNGGALTTTTSSAATTINAGVTISSNSSIAQNAGTFVNDGTIKTTANGAITVTSTTFDSDSGVINAGNGTVTIRPNANVAVTVGSASQGAGFDVTGNALANITAGSLVVGTTVQTGGLTITGNINVSGAGPAGIYNLTFNNGGGYNATGRTITLGTKNLTVSATAAGASDSLTTGTVTGTTGTISMSSGKAITVDGTLNTGSTVSLATTAGDINIYNNVTGSTSVSLNAGGTGNVLLYRATPVVTSTGVNAPGALVFNAGGTVAYSVDATNGKLLVINPTTNAVTTTISVGVNPQFVAIDSANNRAYVTNASSPVVSVINLSNNTVLTTVTLSARANGVAVNNAGTKIFVATGEDSVTVINTANYTTYTPGAPIVVETNGTGVGTYNLTMDSSGSYLYIGNQTSQRVSVMDVATNAIIAGTGGSTGAILVGSRPLGMAANGGFIYVANYLSHDIYTINTGTQAVSSQNGITGVSVGATSTPVGVTVSNNGTFAYTANQTTNTVSVINLSTYAVVDTIALSAAPTSITMSPDGSYAYVSSTGGNSLTKITMAPLVTGSTVNLTSSTGNIGTVAIPVRTVASTLNVNSGGNVYVEQTGNVSIGASSVTGSFQLASSGTLTNTGAITAGSLNWFTNNKDITLGNNLNVTNAANIYAVGSGNINWSAGTLTAGSVNLFSNTGNIGSVANPIRTATVSLRANTSGSGNVALSNTGSVTLLDSTAGGSFTLTNSVGTTITIAGRVVVPSTAGHNITIQTSGNNAANRINVQAKVVAGGTVTLTATGGTVSYASATGISTQLSATVAGVTNATAVALDSTGTFAYVTDSVNWPPTTGYVRVVSTATNTVVATITVGANPEGVAITPDGKYLFVTNRFSDNVSVIDLQAGGTFRQVVATISLPAGSEPWGISFNPTGGSNQAYVVNTGSSTISVLNWQTRAVTATISGLPVGVFASYPKGVAYNPAGTRAYIADQFNRAVTVINTGTNAIVTNISVGDGPFGIATATVGGTPFAYVTNVSDNTVSVINLNTNTVTATINVGNNPIGVSLTPTGTFAYVVNQGSNSVSVINTSTNAVVATVPVGSLPMGMGNFVGTVGGNVRAYIANKGGTVSVLDPSPALVDPYLVVLNAANVGTAADPIGILTEHLQINATGDVYAKISGSTIIDASTIGGTLNLQADGNITAGGDIVAGSVALQTPLSLLVGNITSTAGNISLNGNTVDVSALASVTANNGSVFLQQAGGGLSVTNAALNYTGGLLQSFVNAAPAANTGVTAANSTAVLQTGALPMSFSNSAQLWAGGGFPVMSAAAVSALDQLGTASTRANNNANTTTDAVVGGSFSLGGTQETERSSAGSGADKKNMPLSGIVERIFDISTADAAANSFGQGLRSTAVRADESALSAVIKDVGADFVAGNSKVQLRAGDILVSSLKPTAVNAGKHTVLLDKGVVALIRVRGDRVAVANLFDKRYGDVSLLVNNNRSLKIELGEEVMLADSSEDVSAAINDGVARRSVKTLDVSDTSLASSQFSYMSVLGKSPLLQSVHADVDSSSRSISSRIEKAAACLMQVTAAKGPYKAGAQP